MRQIADFLNKFKNMGLKELAIKEAIVLSANEILGGEFLKKSMVDVKGGDVFIKVTGAVKSEILLSKDKIINLAKTKSFIPFEIDNLK